MMEGLRSLSRTLLALSAMEACTMDVSGNGRWGERRDLAQSDVDADSSGLDGQGSDDADDPDDANAGTRDDDAQAEPDAEDAGMEADDVEPESDGSASGLASDAGMKPSVKPVIRILDGVTTAGEWDDATWTHQNIASNWGNDRNALRSLAVALENDFLWVRVEGPIEVTNALVVYVDSVPGAGLSPHVLSDRLGTIDDVISCGVTTLPAHAPDFAWATRVTDGSGALIGAPGWRALDMPGDLGWIDDKEAPSVCLQGVCETRISRASIRSQGSVHVFARLVNGTGDLISNQGLPAQASVSTDKATDIMSVDSP